MKTVLVDFFISVPSFVGKGYKGYWGKCHNSRLPKRNNFVEWSCICKRKLSRSKRVYLQLFFNWLWIKHWHLFGVWACGSRQLYKKTPSEYFIECLKDCVRSSGKRERREKLLLNYPQFYSFYRKISDDYSTNQLISANKYNSPSSEAHFFEIRKWEPELLEWIPQYHLASFLGIKLQSLSKKRKRLSHHK